MNNIPFKINQNLSGLTLHSIGLSRIGDTIAKYEKIVALEELFKTGINGAAKKIILGDALLKHVRKLKDCLR